MKSFSFTVLFIALGFAVWAQDSLNVSTLFHWQDTSLVPSAAFNNTYNEVWGYEQDGREYAIIGSTAGTHFFDVTDAANAVEVDFIAGFDPGDHIIHRDYHDYNGYLYMVSDEGFNALQIVDLSPLPDSVRFVGNYPNTLVRSHNIFIDSASARLYACGTVIGQANFADLAIYSLADPENPTLLTAYNDNFYFHDIYVQNDTAIGNNGNDGLFIYDFTDVNDIQILGSLTNYIEQGYNHSGWASPDMQTYYLADETHGKKIKTLDISDFTDIEVVDTFGSNIDPESVPHNLIIKDDYLYVSYYHDGFYIFDISNPANPSVVGFYDTYLLPDHVSYRGAWGVYPFLPSGKVLVSDMQSGLFVFDVADALTSVPEHQRENKQFRMSPNPFSSRINFLNLGARAGNYQVRVIDLTGKVIEAQSVYTSPLNPFQLQVRPDLSPGIYFIEVSNDGYLQVEKMYKKND